MPDPAPSLATDAQPRLAPGVRLHFDTRRQAWLLLAPERIIETEGPAHDILSRCDGSRTVDQIVAELSALYTAASVEILGDVMALLDELRLKRLVTL